MIQFVKYHALGNDYLVIEPHEKINSGLARRICRRNEGVGADGILVGPLPGPAGADFALRIINPDGSEAEKSGNGLRIFARYLWDTGRVSEAPFTVQTLGGRVRCRVHPGGGQVTVEMGQVSFDSQRIPVTGPPRQVLNERLAVEGQTLTYCAASLGNPHCVILDAPVSAETARHLGPWIENEARFPNRTNVQFLQVLDRENLRIEIWERGAGYTLASGSSSCAAAAVAHRLGLVGPQVSVHMPGGALQIVIAPDWAITMTGPVVRVFQGEGDF